MESTRMHFQWIFSGQGVLLCLLEMHMHMQEGYSRGSAWKETAGEEEIRNGTSGGEGVSGEGLEVRIWEQMDHELRTTSGFRMGGSDIEPGRSAVFRF